MIALLVATLIGVFITPDGIVIGADTALSNLGGQVASQQKSCITGPRSVATMQGAYLAGRYGHEGDRRVAQPVPRFVRAGRQLTVADDAGQQADHIANELETDLVEFLERLPAADVITYASTPVVARIAVSGYGERGPESVVVGLGIAIDRPTNRWEAQVRPLARLTFSECGVRFHGQESVVNVVRTDKGVRIPKADIEQPDVARLAGLLRGECGHTTTRTAPAMFLQAVRLDRHARTWFRCPTGHRSACRSTSSPFQRDGAIQTTRSPRGSDNSSTPIEPQAKQLVQDDARGRRDIQRPLLAEHGNPDHGLDVCSEGGQLCRPPHDRTRDTPAIAASTRTGSPPRETFQPQRCDSRQWRATAARRACLAGIPTARCPRRLQRARARGA